MFNNRPSLLFKSPRGLHAYWYLTGLFATELLITKARIVLSDLQGVEVRPTFTQSLRIDRKDQQLHPDTLKTMSYDIADPVKYFVIELFGDGVLRDSIKSDLQTRKDRLTNYTNSARIARLEKLLCPIRPGESNDKFIRLMAGYYQAGLTVPQAENRLLENLSISYYGDLKNPHRLRQRVQSSFSNLQNIGYDTIKQPIQLDMYDLHIIDQLVLSHPFTYRRDKQVQNYMTGLIQYVRSHDNIKKQPELVAVYDYLYPFYRKNTKEGYYPLPRSVLRPLNHRYYEINDWLKDLEFLKDSPYSYNADIGICKYYGVDTTLNSLQAVQDVRKIAVQVLKHSGLTLGQLSRLTGIDDRNLRKYMSGQRNFSKETASRILRILQAGT